MAIGTTAALLGSAAIGAGASIISGNKAAKASAQGADAAAAAQLEGTRLQVAAQERGLDRQIKFSREALNRQLGAYDNALAQQLQFGREGMAQQGRYLDRSLDLAKNERDWQRRNYNIRQRQLGGIREAGGNALNALRYELGLGDQPEWYEGYSMSPMAQYALEEGQDEIYAGMAARGLSNSGAAMQALDDRRAQIVNADRGEYFDRLTGLANNRLNAIQGLGAAPSNSGASNVLGQMATAQGQNTSAMQTLVGSNASGVGGAFGNLASNVTGAISGATSGIASAYGTGYDAIGRSRLAAGQAQAGQAINVGNAFNNFLGNAASIYGYSQSGGFGGGAGMTPGFGAGGFSGIY